MKTDFVKWLGWILLFICLWFKGCRNNEDPKTVEIPEIKKELPTQKPVHIPAENALNDLEENLSKHEVVRKGHLENINVLNKENETILLKFAKENDSLKRILMYKNAISINAFKSVFEDDYIKLELDGLVRGEVQSLTPNYTIKPRQVPALIKPVKFRLLAGVGVSNTIAMDKPLFSAKLGFQNKKGNILNVGYDSEKRITIGYDFTVFKIK
ncbi:hypothetical protein JJL45_05235 [Tamlana sp. s12]|uniref:hypothetical protein n=1 Tax=Tamlana sp. s12 TaxID=1630406 RepID=UPI0007FB9B47|nr:hypothetical protein [Tamlana sp. s12]OBQ56092.1 hypothetical protein VQ01_06825 [Tamlana sp. s12]QQY83395.1 hypothetical protein JJL45_05235 [Tamlana sp. s12]